MNEDKPSKVVVEFHSSSTKAGQEAYRVQVTDLATAEDVGRTVQLAALARRQALAELGGQLERDLEASLNSKSGDGAL